MFNFFLVLLVFVVLIAVLSLHLIDDRSQRWSLKTEIIDVIVSFRSYCVLWFCTKCFQSFSDFFAIFGCFCLII